MRRTSDRALLTNSRSWSASTRISPGPQLWRMTNRDYAFSLELTNRSTRVRILCRVNRSLPRGGRIYEPLQLAENHLCFKRVALRGCFVEHNGPGAVRQGRRSHQSTERRNYDSADFGCSQPCRPADGQHSSGTGAGYVQSP